MSVLMLTTDLMFVSQVSNAAKQAGHTCQMVSKADVLVEKISAETKVVILDLSLAGIEPADLVPRLRQAATAPLTLIAFAPHVHEAKLAAATAAGCEEVLNWGQFHSTYGRLLTQYLAPPIS